MKTAGPGLRALPALLLPLLLLLLLSAPLCAQAHSPIKGVMPFYGGVLHPFTVPAHVLAILSIGLFTGRQPREYDGRLLASAFVPVVLGVVLAKWFGDPDTDIPLLLATCVAALAVAWGRPLPAPLAMAILAANALLLGLGSAPDGIEGRARWLHLAGCCLGVMVGISAMSIVVEHVKRPWQQVALRVVCSWIAASALLVLALAVFVPRAKQPVAGSVLAPVPWRAALAERLWTLSGEPALQLVGQHVGQHVGRHVMQLTHKMVSIV